MRKFSEEQNNCLPRTAALLLDNSLFPYISCLSFLIMHPLLGLLANFQITLRLMK